MGSFQETIRLVREARAGDRACQEALLERYLPRVRAIVALRLGRRLGELAEHEDIVQETLLDAFRGIDTFDEVSEGSFRNWLARLVENNVKDALRRGRAQKRGEGAARRFADFDSSVLSESVLAGGQPTPSQLAGVRELEGRLHDALLQLDERDRRVIELRRLCEMSHAEIARELGLGGESSARSLFSRAMGRLSALL